MKHSARQAVDIKRRAALSQRMWLRVYEALFLATAAVCVFLVISLATYNAADPGWMSTGTNPHPLNRGGWVGALCAEFLLTLCGLMAYVLPPLLILTSWLNVYRVTQQKNAQHDGWIRNFGWLLVVISGCCLARIYWHWLAPWPASAGGVIGDIVSQQLLRLFNRVGSTIFLVAILLGGASLITGFSWLIIIEWIGAHIQNRIEQLMAWLIAYFHMGLRNLIAKIPRFTRSPHLPSEIVSPGVPPDVTDQINGRIEPSLNLDLAQSVLGSTKVGQLHTATSPRTANLHSSETEGRLHSALARKAKSEFVKIPMVSETLATQLARGDLLNLNPKQASKAFSDTSLTNLSALVEMRLADFGVTVKVVGIHPGPIITRFELDLAPGIKVSKITGLAKDIARSLSTVSVRVVEVIPGKSVIGLEIPNQNRELVTLRAIIESSNYIKSRSVVTLALGKDTSGNPIITDLAKMPHLLVAGTTGSGKSVSLNAMLLSMLFKATPKQLRLVMIDPKMLELSVYDGIPHLLAPVITDMKHAANALRWCVAEMERRYKLMAAQGVRNLAGYNQKISDAAKHGTTLTLPPALMNSGGEQTYAQPLPLIVVIIDELADMMMVVGKKVEDLIARIAQKARAAGIHLIVATQRPSVDVITGLIKANIPARIAFQVSSRIDSRTILDQQGAEQLLGHGDMLYLPPGAGLPQRIHGAYVADDEVHRVVAAWRKQGEPEYVAEIIADDSDTWGGMGDISGERDALYDDAVRIVLETRRASTSLIQRRLRIGFNRAARIMEEMEAAGIVSGIDGSGGREVIGTE